MGKDSGRRKTSTDEGLGNQGRAEKESEPLPGSSPGRIVFSQILLLLVVSFAVYVNALTDNFVYDDHYQILSNPWITDIRNLPKIFSSGVWSFMPRLSTSNYYRPMMHVVYMANYYLFGLRPWGFHLVNILFHCGTSVLVLLIMYRFLGENRDKKFSVWLSPAFIAATLFATDPIHTEAVTWIAGLPDVAFTFFYLLSFYFYMLSRDGAKKSYLVSILSFAMSTLFKEPALTLPILIIAYDYLFRKPDDTRPLSVNRYIPYAAVSAVYFLIRYYALGGFAPVASYAGMSTYQSVINVFPLLREYLSSLLWPFGMNVWHMFHPARSIFDLSEMVSIVLTAIFFAGLVVAYRKNRALSFSLVLIVVPLLPVFYIKAIGGKPFAERYLYLPSVGYVLLLGISLTWLKRKLPNSARSVAVAFLVIAGLYSVLTVNRNKVWKNDITLWSDAVKKAPDAPEPHSNLGSMYNASGLTDKAIKQYRLALSLEPDYAKAHIALGRIYMEHGLNGLALQEFLSVKSGPKKVIANAYYNVGLLLASEGRTDEAVEQYQKALQLSPRFAEVYYKLALIYQEKGLPDDAMRFCQKALLINPRYIEAHSLLGLIYYKKGAPGEALEQFRLVARLQPNSANAHFNLGRIYLLQGLKDKARRQFEMVLKIKPDDYQTRRLLAETSR